MKTRGQSALEYLVTYGWAILAIVIIAAILWYFGVFNPSKWTTEKQCGGFSSLQCIDFKYDSNGTLLVSVGNKVGNKITNLNLTTVTYANGTTEATNGACASTTLNPNGKTTCMVTTLADGAVGQAFDQLDVTFGFTDDKTRIAHKDSGFVKGKYE